MKNRKGAARALRYGTLLILLAGIGACADAPPSVHGGEGFDIVIRGGRVIDPETGLDAVRQVGIVGDRIAAVSQDELRGEREIDATGLVVAPGFVDILASYPNTDESAIYKVFDGVTTLISMHGGPVDIEDWYAVREAARPYVHFGTTVGHAALRTAVGLKDRYAAATTEQVDEMERLARRAIRAGAIGIGFGVAYVPGSSREEVLRLFQVAADEGVPAHLHIRAFGPVPPENNSIAAVQEVIANSAATGASAQIVHINSMLAGSLRTALGMLEGARARGIDVLADAYPYTAAATGLGSTTFDDGWQERFGGIGYGDLQLVRTGERLTAETFRQGRETGESAIIHYMPEAEIRAALAHPHVMVASDGVIRNGRGHPRGAGTFARVLGRYVREDGSLELAEAIRKMTLMPAQRLEEAAPVLRRKGRLSPGADADVVIFDPATVIDRATFDEPARRSAGIVYTIVAGTVVVDAGELREGAKAGQPIHGRYAGER